MALTYEQLIQMLERRITLLEEENLAAKRRIRLLEQHFDELYTAIYGRSIDGIRAKTARVVRTIKKKINGGPDGKGTGE